MAQQNINIGSSANKGDGDPIRVAFTKVNANFTDLYSRVVVLEGGGVAVAQDIQGDIFAQDSSLAYNSATNTHYGSFVGALSGDVTGSVFADNSTVLIDGVAGTISAGALTGTLPAIDGSALTGVSASSMLFSNITSTPTTIAGYGITDAAPIDSPAFTTKIDTPKIDFSTQSFMQVSNVGDVNLEAITIHGNGNTVGITMGNFGSTFGSIGSGGISIQPNTASGGYKGGKITPDVFIGAGIPKLTIDSKWTRNTGAYAPVAYTGGDSVIEIIGDVVDFTSATSVDFTGATVTGLTVTGDVTGSVFGDDSTLLVDGINNKIVGAVDTTSIRTSEDKIALGENTGVTNQAYGAIAIGPYAGTTDQGSQTVAVGTSAGRERQGSQATALGRYAGQNDQGANSVAVGSGAGQTTQGDGSVAIGNEAGQTTQSTLAVAVGQYAGYDTQGTAGVAIGNLAGRASQGVQAIAVGQNAGNTSQGAQSIAIGDQAGQTTQSPRAVAVGQEAGKTTQNTDAVAIGRSAGETNQGVGAVALGYGAGRNNQAANSIVINASGLNLENTTASSLVVKPIRNAIGTTMLMYDATSGEVTHSGSIQESFATTNGATGVTALDCSTGNVHYLTAPAGDITANFTNLNLTAEYATNVTVVIDQGGTEREITAVQIGGVAQTIVWQGNSAPTGTANGVDSFSFTILNDGGTYVVLGQMVAFGGV